MLLHDIGKTRQLLLFDNMRYGAKRPTDIDAMFDLNGEVLILYEVKYGDSPVPRGQERALENLVRMARRARIKGVAIIASHGTRDASKPIDLAFCEVVRWFGSKHLAWRTPTCAISVREFTDRIMDEYAGMPVSSIKGEA